MKEKRARILKALFRFYFMSVIENLTEFDLKEMLMDKLSKDTRKLGLSIAGFFFALILSAIGLSLIVLRTGHYIQSSSQDSWLNADSSSGFILIGIAGAIFFLIYRFAAHRYEEIRKIRSAASPLQALVAPYLKELKAEQKIFIEEHALHLPLPLPLKGESSNRASR